MKVDVLLFFLLFVVLHQAQSHNDVIMLIKQYIRLPNDTSSSITTSDLSQIVEMMLRRVSCYAKKLPCSSCITTNNILRALNIDEKSTHVFREKELEKFSTVLVNFIVNLDSLCTENAPQFWSNATYETFMNLQLTYEKRRNESLGFVKVLSDDSNGMVTLSHDNDATVTKPALFTIPMLTQIFNDLNATYKTGLFLSHNIATLIDTNVSCSNDKRFTSWDIFNATSLRHPHEGATGDELGRLNLVLMYRMLKGDCLLPDPHSVYGLPLEMDFLSALFQQFAPNTTSAIPFHGFAKIAKILGIGRHEKVDGGVSSRSKEDKAHSGAHRDAKQQHTGDVSAEMLVTSSPARTRSKRFVSHISPQLDNGTSLMQSKLSIMCLSKEELLRAFYIDPHQMEISKEDFLAICPALIQQATQGCRHAEEDDYVIGHELPSDIEKFGYGTAAVVLNCACTLLGLIIVKWRNSKSYKYMLTFMLGLAVGALVADSFLDLIPHALELHGYEPELETWFTIYGKVVHVNYFIWKMMAVCAGIWLLFALHLVMHKGAKQSHKHITFSQVEVNSVKLKAVKQIDAETESENKTVTEDFYTDHMISSSRFHTSASPSVGWMVMCGDTIHKIADGLAIGAAFGSNWRTGVSTSLALLLHEVPHELGDVAVLLHVGWSPCKVAILQIASSLSTFVGLYVGIFISQTDATQSWILIIVAGIFIYLALAEVMPEIGEVISEQSGWGTVLAANTGIAISMFCMVVMAIFEEHLIM